MPEPTTAEAREQLREFRRVVASAVGELRSQEVRNSYASVSLEELIDQQIVLLEGTADATSPSRLERIRKVKKDLTDNIEGMKASSPANFRRHDPSSDVNTAVEE